MRSLWSSGKTLAANAGGRGFESHRGLNLFSQSTLLEWNVKNCFVKLIKNLNILEYCKRKNFKGGRILGDLGGRVQSTNIFPH